LKKPDESVNTPLKRGKTYNDELAALSFTYLKCFVTDDYFYESDDELA
jgi:hypothetical protein